MRKAALRKLMLQQRRALPAQEVQQRSERIVSLFFKKFSLRPGLTIHIFLPILRNNEVNTWPIIERLRLEHPEVRVVVPVTDIAGNNLSHHILTNEAVLIYNAWGIPEPQHAQIIQAQEVDMVLIPLLAFDLSGHRVGYGKGYYDRFLASCRADVVKIGLSLEPAVESIDDPNPYDVPLDFAITPSEVWKRDNLKPVQ